MPVAKDGTGFRKKATSAPSRTASGRSPSTEPGCPVRSRISSSAAAASEEPPPKPAETGMRLARSTWKSSDSPNSAQNARTARQAKLSTTDAPPGTLRPQRRIVSPFPGGFGVTATSSANCGTGRNNVWISWRLSCGRDAPTFRRRLTFAGVGLNGLRRVLLFSSRKRASISRVQHEELPGDGPCGVPGHLLFFVTGSPAVGVDDALAGDIVADDQP